MTVAKTYEDLSYEVKIIIAKANIFFSKEYNDYAIKTSSAVWYIYDNNYILPVNVFQKVRIRYGLFVSEPFVLSKHIENERLKKFLNEAVDCLKREKLAWISTSAAALFDDYPDNSLRIPFGSHIVNLSLSEDELWQKMHSKHRNSVRRAEKNNVEIISGESELIPDYLKADEETWKRSGKSSYGRLFFDIIIEKLKQKAILYVAYKDNTPQAGACFFYNGKMCYYMYGASISNPEPGAANLLQWTAIKDMKARGVENFSFVGCRINEDVNSKFHGIQRFKERFGGKLWQGYMFKCILNPQKYKLFKLLYFLKKHTKMTDAVDQELQKWSELNRRQKNETSF